ncbi:MAG: hypothetical protein OEV00_00685 [Acidobacteriota bacterium]|nr:hypothetical protein [Acidobacteriota bacterium]MDH3783820.1 hypothetical protein [Acidobacteriota bacterium]
MKRAKGLWIVLVVAILSVGATHAMDMVVPDLSVIKVAEGDIYDRSLIWNNVDETPTMLPPVISPGDEENGNETPVTIPAAHNAVPGANKPVPGLIVPGGDSLTGMVGPRSIRVASPRLNADREIRYLIRTLN